MTAQFAAAGYEVVPFGSACDVGVIHSCTVTARAERTSLRAARALKKLRPPPLVVLAGCAAEVDTGALAREPAVDLLAGQAEKLRLPALLAGRRDTRASPVPLLPDGRRGAAAAVVPSFRTTRALVKVQDGCDFHCAYCIVPAARGTPRSRPAGEIMEEIRRLADRGYREVVLTGANLGCYGDGRRDLARLVESVEAIPGVRRIRLSSIEISTVEREIVDLMAASGKLCRYLHFPLQSGDDGVLSAMGRRYTAKAFRKLVEAAARLPRLGLGTDILVGFPGEDDRAFRNTAAMVRDLPFNNLHVFPYSRRPGTPAAERKDRVPEACQRERAAEIAALGLAKRAGFAQSFTGHAVSVLIERIDARGRARGWTGEYLPARVTGRDIAVNDIVEFTPDSAENGELRARIPGRESFSLA